MSLESLKNCPKCGKLYVHAFRKVCPDCYDKIEADYEIVYEFIHQKENRGCSLKQISEGTGVSENQIIEYIREGRISIASFPNLGYPCKLCRQSIIIEGEICPACKLKYLHDLKDALEDQSKLKEESRHYYQIQRNQK